MVTWSFFRIWSLFMLEFFTMSHLFGSLTPPVVHSKGPTFPIKYFRYQTFYKTRYSWPMTHVGASKSKNPNFQKISKFKKSYLTTPNTCFYYYLHLSVPPQWSRKGNFQTHDPGNAKSWSEDKNEIESYLVYKNNLGLLCLQYHLERS